MCQKVSMGRERTVPTFLAPHSCQPPHFLNEKPVSFPVMDRVGGGETLFMLLSQSLYCIFYPIAADNSLLKCVLISLAPSAARYLALPVLSSLGLLFFSSGFLLSFSFDSHCSPLAPLPLSSPPFTIHSHSLPSLTLLLLLFAHITYSLSHFSI